jgi:hypothetical protein
MHLFRILPTVRQGLRVLSAACIKRVPASRTAASAASALLCISMPSFRCISSSPGWSPRAAAATSATKFVVRAASPNCILLKPERGLIRYAASACAPQPSQLHSMQPVSNAEFSKHPHRASPLRPKRSTAAPQCITREQCSLSALVRRKSQALAKSAYQKRGQQRQFFVSHPSRILHRD